MSGGVIISTVFVVAVLCLLWSNIGELKSEFIQFRDDHKATEKQIVELKGDQKNMKNQIVDLKGELLKFRDDLIHVDQMTSAALDMKHTVTANERKVTSIEDSVRQLSTNINDMLIKYHVLDDNYREYKDSNNKQNIKDDGRFADLSNQIKMLNMKQTELRTTGEWLWSNLEKNLKELRDSTKEETRARVEREERDAKRYREQGGGTAVSAERERDASYQENMMQIGKDIFSLIRRFLSGLGG